jgi:hypothetical protein
VISLEPDDDIEVSVAITVGPPENLGGNAPTINTAIGVIAETEFVPNLVGPGFGGRPDTRAVGSRARSVNVDLKVL